MKLTRKQLEQALKSLPVYAINSQGIYRIPVSAIDVALNIPMTPLPEREKDDFITFYWDENEQDWTIEVST